MSYEEEREQWLQDRRHGGNEDAVGMFTATVLAGGILIACLAVAVGFLIF